MPENEQQNEASDTKKSLPGESTWFGRSFAPFRKALTRGLAIVLPPLLTLVLFLWAWNTIDSYVLGPLESTATTIVVWSIDDSQDDDTIKKEIRERESTGSGGEKSNPVVKLSGDHEVFESIEHGPMVKINQKWIPKEIYDLVSTNPGAIQPTTSTAYYHRYVELRYLQRQWLIPAFLALFILILYILGRLLAAGMGRFMWRSVESIIERVPLVRNVYSAVKQVTDFAFSENEIQFTRIVAVEYPRKGVWSMGFVTGESMLDIRTAANEPIISVLMPTSPMPMTGFIISVPKSETIDLNITMDQAIQFCVSCGVVVPPQQSQRNMIEGDVKHRIEGMIQTENGSDGDDSEKMVESGDTTS